MPHLGSRAFPAGIWQGPPVAHDAASSGGIPGRRLLIGLLVIFLFAALPGVVVPTLMCRATDPELYDSGAVPAFALTDERGQPFTEAALRGHVTIVSFVFTRCDAICPTTTMKAGELQEKTFDVGSKVKLLTVSIDPEYDTPPVLAAYAAKFRADPTRWRFVTGPRATIEALVEHTFQQNMQVDGVTAGGAPSIAHQGYFALVDANGHFRQSYPPDDVSLDRMTRDARYLARIAK
jgi:protein SCO1/2